MCDRCRRRLRFGDPCRWPPMSSSDAALRDGADSSQIPKALFDLQAPPVVRQHLLIRFSRDDGRTVSAQSLVQEAQAQPGFASVSPLGSGPAA